MGGSSRKPLTATRLARAGNFALGLLCAAALAAAQEHTLPSQQPPTQIRVRVDRVNVGVIVTDAKGRFVETLRRQDFQVFDNGAEQAITDFAAIAEPAQVVLLVESGPAVYLLESSHLQAASALLEGLSAGDRVAVVGYADRPVPLLDFTADKQNAVQALGALRFNLGFGQLNLSANLGAVLDELARFDGKETVVLLSTGVDTSSADAAEKLLERLRTSDVRVLAVALGGELRNGKPRAGAKVSPEKVAAAEEGFAQAGEWLKTVAETSGGRVYFPKSAKEFAAAYAEIAQLVRHEYSLSFVPPAKDAKIHAIDVRVRALAAPNELAAYRVDHRRGYVAPAPTTP